MKRSRRPQRSKRKETPAVVYVWSLCLAVGGYLIARIALDGSPHPYHWLGGVVGGAVGFPVGGLWFRLRGDLF